jgi:dihydroneopterin aldolase
VDYEDVYKIVSHRMQQPSRLLEHVVDQILRDIEDAFPIVTQAEVKVYKLNPPIGGECNAAIVSAGFTR